MVLPILVPQQVAGGLRYLARIGAVAPPPLGRAGGEALLPHDAAHGPLADPRIRPGPGVDLRIYAPVSVGPAALLECGPDGLPGGGALRALAPGQGPLRVLIAALGHAHGGQQLPEAPPPPQRLHHRRLLPVRQPVRVGARVFFYDLEGRLAHVQLELHLSEARLRLSQHVLQLPDVVGKLVDLLGHGKPFLLVSPSIMAHDLPAPCVRRGPRHAVPLGDLRRRARPGLELRDHLHLPLQGHGAPIRARAPAFPLARRIFVDPLAEQLAALGIAERPRRPCQAPAMAEVIVDRGALHRVGVCRVGDGLPDRHHAGPLVFPPPAPERPPVGIPQLGNCVSIAMVEPDECLEGAPSLLLAVCHAMASLNSFGPSSPPQSQLVVFTVALTRGARAGPQDHPHALRPERAPRGAGFREGGLLPLRSVASLGGLLGRSPPGLVGDVPVDRLPEPLGEVGVRRPPAQLALELGAVDRVAAVMAGAVGDPVEVLGVLSHRLQDHAQDRDVVLLAVGSDEVGLPHAALGQDVPDGAGVVLGVDPVADVLALPVELGADAVDDVGDLPGDELLHVLVGAVVVGAVGDRGAQSVGAGPCAHEHVGAGLGRAVGARRLIRRLLGELGGVVERQVAVDLVGGDVVVADAVFADGLQQAEGSLDVGAQERLRVGDGVVVVALCGVVDDGVVARHQLVEQRGVADVAHDELHAVGGQARDVLGVAGVGQLVQDGHVDARVVVHDVVHEVAADEAAAARDDDVLRFKNLRHETPHYMFTQQFALPAYRLIHFPSQQTHKAHIRHMQRDD